MAITTTYGGIAKSSNARYDIYMNNNGLRKAIIRTLDGREMDENGKIRLKNGATLARTLAKEDPVYNVFSPKSTLTNLRRYYGVKSEKELRKVALIKARAQKLDKNNG